MLRSKVILLSLFATLTATLAQRTHAAMPVIDVGAIAQLIQQIRTLQQQLTVARDQLTQARDQLRAMTGARNMDRLLAGTVRNYLPADWRHLESVMQGKAAAYGALAASTHALVTANAILSPAQLVALSPDQRAQIEAERRSAAMLQVLAREALVTTSARFAALQQLITAIPAANDQKAILDLNARIEAEQGMLQNEQTKLDVLHQIAQAEERARKQRTRERAIASIGSLRTLPPMNL